MPVKKIKEEEEMVVTEVKYHAPALEKGLDILEYISMEGKPVSQTDIATGIEKSPNEIYRMLICLEHRGYLLRDDVSGKYRPSMKLYNLSHRHSPIDEIRKASRYPMDDLAEKIKQSCHIGVLYQDKLIVISQARSPEPIALSIEEGSLFPLMLTASGKILLAFMEENSRFELLRRNDLFSSYSLRKQQKFLASLEEIREEGHYLTPSDLATGVMDITVPVRNGSEAIASLTISILMTQMKDTIPAENIVADAKLAAQKISANLGFKVSGS
ncbi:IclR family transcriptional regulator [Arachidicoccus sp.]|jgi:DNA-binding IclR family transcriptional regulator|uniref:IclR family transcriptional regulator n=1 Tax=Arachidicoccus sp. TaxID=1872624 RepID=UPI003D1957FF